MDYRIYLSVCLFLFGFQYLSEGQEIIPPSPESAGLIRSINLPVNHYTGTAVAQIPLTTVVSKDIKVPITFSYQASGNKVQDIAPWTGLGWNLSAGGKVTRLVRGKPDEQGYCNPAGCGNIGETTSWTIPVFDERYENGFDGDPDMFYFQLPGDSGTFVCNYDGKAYSVPYQNIDIEWKDKTYWIITDERGYKYYFGETYLSRESTHSERISIITEPLPSSTPQYVKTNIFDKVLPSGWDQSIGDSESIEYVSTWHLNKIIAPNGNMVTFNYCFGCDLEYKMYNYERNTYIYDVKKDLYESWYSQGDGVYRFDFYKDISTNIKVKSPKYLKEIIYEQGRVEFTSSGERLDLINGRKLDLIKVYDVNNILLKTYEFSYGYFTSDDGSEKRLKLNNIIHKAGLKNQLVASFKYCTEANLPNRNSKDYDYAGYYNRANNSTQYGGTELKTFISSIYHDERGCYKISGANRNPDLLGAKANVLTEIHYNTGGYREFVYELKYAGLRIKKIKDYLEEGNLSNEIEYLYTNDEGESSMEHNSYPYECTQILAKELKDDVLVIGHNWRYVLKINSQPYNSFYEVTGVPFGYSQVIEKYSNNGYKKYKFSNYSKFPDSTPRLLVLREDGNRTITNNFKGVTKCQQFWKRGLPVSISTYDEDNNLLVKDSFEYETNAASKKAIWGGQQIYGLDSLESRYCSLYAISSQPVYLKRKIITGAKVIPSIQEYLYNETYMVPTKITTTDVENNIWTEELAYPFSYTTTNVTEDNTEGWAIKTMMDRHIHNVPIERVVKKNEKLMGAQLSTYKIINRTPENNIVVGDGSFKLFTTKPISSGFDNYSISSTSTQKDARYELMSKNDNYDTKGNPVQLHKNNCVDVSYVYNETLPIAEVVNAKRSVPHREGFDAYEYADFTQGAISSTTKFFSLQFDQSIKLSLENIVYNALDPINEREVLIEVKNLNGVSVWTDYLSLNSKSLVSPVLKEGCYSLDIMSLGRLSFLLQMSYKGFRLIFNRTNEVFYTSFEDVNDAIFLSSAKTGSKACKKQFSIETRDFIPGVYLLSYWKSTDGKNWEYFSQNINISSSTNSYSVGSTSYYIDELRLLPKDARITTFTYKENVGKTSETDNNGITKYYEYDQFGRLLRVLDNSRNVRKEYDYKYAN